MLKVLKTNPRYFTDGSGKAIYLVGSHTWSNFKDYGITDPPNPFDYEGFLDFLQKYNHNFFRLWSQEIPRSVQGILNELWYRYPFPWPRTGPGMATDGKPKFNLSRMDQSFFDRMYKRVEAAQKRGIYVSVMLFDGYAPQFYRNPVDGFPYDRNNNINGVSCDGMESQSLTNTQVTEIQEAYVRKVIDTVNDFDNVLYEIANEAGEYSTGWQYHMINYIKNYEAGKPKQHPVGMTFQWEGGSNSDLFNSPADWISPAAEVGYGYPIPDPPAADGSKVIINDTDHSYFYTGLQETGLDIQRAWVWMNFARGNNIAFMDPYLVIWPGRNASDGINLDPYWDTLRINMGYTRIYAEKMGLAGMKPMNGLATTGYCLANPGEEYFVYLPSGGTVAVDLRAFKYEFAVEWFNTVTGTASPGNNVTGGRVHPFKTPFNNDAALYIYISFIK